MISIRGVVLLVIVFAAGFVSASVANVNVENVQKPLASIIPFGTAPEIDSPSDWITEDQIRVYDDRVIIDIENPEWARFTDTNSMDPVFDYGSNAIEIVPEKPEQIHVGDIVSYKSKYASGTIIHRVIEIGNDEDGWYARMKGDNNPIEDPEKIRFGQIQRVVVAIIY
ncbi:signal peptidase I [Candidatus Woesearchaeota archaeon]|nr:signal peptidase I [Candidatus Woesearchaeota archaeon]